MEQSKAIELITRQVMEKLGEGGDLKTTGGCSSEGCPPAWDGVGTVTAMLTAGASRISAIAPLGSCPDKTLARLIDHTMLKPEATEQEVRQLCAEARANCFMSVCVNPTWISLCQQLLRGSGVKVCTVIGFPLGASSTRVKEFETRVAIEDGADEVDMVINVGALKSGNWKDVARDVQAVVRSTRGNVISKVILETCLLTPAEIKRASEICRDAGAHFVKTSTGFNKGGATVEAIRIMRETVGPELGVKASGGIRDHETALNMVAAGASRIGASASVAIVNCQASNATY